MKRIFLLVLLALILAPLAQGFAAVPVPPPDPRVVEQRKTNARLNEVNEDIKSLNQRTADMLRAIRSERERNEKRRFEVTSSINGLQEASSNQTKAIVMLSEIMTGFQNKAISWNNSLVELKSTLDSLKLILYTIAGLLIITSVVVIILHFRGKTHVTDERVEVARAFNSRTTEILNTVREEIGGLGRQINERVDDLSGRIDDMPDKVSKKVKELDPRPFEVEAGGHHIVYTPPTEGINAGYYEILNLPADVEITDLAKLEREIKTNRGEAVRSVQSTMRQYYAGKFKGDDARAKMMTALIEHLIKTGELKV